MKKLLAIDVRCEGEVNVYWTYIYSDGSKEEFYAYEESARYAVSDDFVDSKDKALANVLYELSIDALSYLKSYMHGVEVTYCPHYNGTMIKYIPVVIKHQEPEE